MGQKRKLSSRSLHQPSSSSTDAAEGHRQPVSVDEGNEMPERKKMKMETSEKCLQVEDKATFSGLEVLPPANQQQVQTPPAQIRQSSASADIVDLTVEDDILSRYDIGPVLREGRFGVFYEGRRLEDDLEVAVKITRKAGSMEYIDIPGHPAPLPLEVGLLILANKGRNVPEVIRLLDWQDQLDQHIMVLEHPSPCEDLVDFMERHGNTLSENKARFVMLQATRAALVCCRCGVFHCDIKLDNFLINPENLEVKLIDFGCGDLLRESGYDVFLGTQAYFPPEYDTEGRYYGKPATVWSLGVLLFTMVTGRFPESNDLQMIEDSIWSEPGLSKECCHLICSLLQQDPSRRIGLGKIIFHKWFKKSDIVSEGKDSQQNKSSKSSFDKKDSAGQTQQVQVQTTAPEHERSTDDESKRTSIPSSLKRKQSSHSSEVNHSTSSTSSSSASEHHQSDNVEEEDEEPKRKKNRTDSVDVSSLFFFFDRRNGPDQGEAQQVQDQAAVALNERRTEDLDSSSTVEDRGLQEPLLSRYEMGRLLGEGGFGAVYEGKRVADGHQVAIKIARKNKNLEYISIPGHPAPLPVEVGLLILVNQDPKVPQIIELLDWEDQPDRYLMVLERPSPCKNLWDYVNHCGGTLGEDVARVVMGDATYAAYMCCQRGVFHRDIKLDNLLINTQTLDIKLIDFGCGDLLRESGYDVLCGTREFFPPEHRQEGRYHGKPATVWSLGVLLFAMVCGRYPDKKDHLAISEGKWFKKDLSDECCDLIRSLLQKVPSQRIGLDEILFHPWFRPQSFQNFS